MRRDNVFFKALPLSNTSGGLVTLINLFVVRKPASGQPPVSYLRSRDGDNPAIDLKKRMSRPSRYNKMDD